jgi:class 3 adenylate cyclase
MSAERKPDLHLEIAHVLFMDVVGYTKLLVNEQREVVHQLNEIVRKTAQFRKSEAGGKLISIPSGDGIALVFFQTPEEPVQCALEISRVLKNHPRLRLRMGVHSGPVDQVKDVNERSNVAGAGINIAQRVMDCGDAGHILVSKRVADDLAQDILWQPHLHDLGECEAKHGARVSVVNLYTDELGNPEIPQKLRGRKHRRGAALAANHWQSSDRRKAALLAGSLLLLLGVCTGFWYLSHKILPKTASAPVISPGPSAATGAIPEKSVAVLPFENLSRDPDNGFFYRRRAR